MKFLQPSTWFGRKASQSVVEEIQTLPNVRPESVAFANSQIHKFARMKEVVGDLMESSARLQRSYDAGVSTAFNADFKGTYGTANTEIFNDFYKVWARARTLAKDTPQGKAILRTHRNNIVGHDPFKLTMKVGATVDKPHPKSGVTVKVFEAENDTNQLIEAEWRQQGLPENFTVRGTISSLEAYNQIVNEAKTVGSILIRLWDNVDNESGFAIDLLESDRLQPNYMAKSQPGDKFGAGNQIRGSIEYDKMGKPLAYWILTRHPGEYYIGQNYPGGAAKDFVREQVPAKDIIHFNNLRDRAEQEIGFTELDACIQAIWRLFQYQKALTYASISSCMKPFWIKKNYPTGMQYSPDDFSRMVEGFSKGSGLPGELGNPVLAQQGIKQRQSTEVPGSTLELEYGMELMQTDPKFPIEAAHEFRMDNDKEIAAAAAVSYADLTGDFQSLGYIAAQMSQRPSRDEAMVFQEHMIMVVVSRIFKRWLRAACMNGVLDGLASRQKEIIRAAHFRGKRFPFTDELREVQALVLKLDAKLISPQRAQDIMPDGDDIENVIAEWSQWNERCEAYGIPLMDAPTAVTEKEMQAEPNENGDLPTAQDGGDAAQPPATTKPSKAKGSVTAKGQKPGTQGRSSHQRNWNSAALTRQLLSETI
jgi:lambda family phage portal protein